MNPLRAMQEAFRKKFKDSNIASDNYKPLFHQQDLDNQTFLDYENITKVNNYWDDIKDKTVPWFPSDSKEQWDENYKNKKDDLIKGGWLVDDKPVKIDYAINKHGMRVNDLSDPIEPGGILWVGDSNVFGMGNHYKTNYTLKTHYDSQFKNRPYHNFGIPGAGIQTFYRRLKVLIEVYKPYGIILEWHWATTRREEFDHMAEFKFHLLVNEIDDDSDANLRKFYNLYSAEASIIRYFTTYDAIKCLCYENDIRIFNMNDSNHLNDKMRIIKKSIWAEPWSEYRFGRDLIHTNNEWHNKRAENMIGIINQIWR